MMYQSFHDYYPEVAETETRCLTLRNDPELPSGTYGFIESFCNDPSCDCRRVFLNVYHFEKKQFLAVIAYGWEDEAFYARWMRNDDPETVAELKGPCLNLFSPQSPLAPVLLERFQMLLSDNNYVERLRRHYEMFKTALPEKGKMKKRKKRKKRA